MPLFIIRILITVLIPLGLSAQATLPMNEAESRREVSMNNAYEKRTNGQYKYYEVGSTEPYTGVLYATYSDGSMMSWQEFSAGIGQGKWINYYQNGQIKESGNYNQNKVEGPIEKYYENGVLKASGVYKDWRIMIGVWKYYDNKGALTKEIDYGTKGSIEEVEEFYNRGDISFRWYSSILKENGFVVE